MQDLTLCLQAEVQALFERMALVGLTTFEPAWVTRMDVAVDGCCRPEDGKLLLDALEACRPPNGWRTRSVGAPRSTVYFCARATEDVKARSYCRNLKTRSGEPFGLIRLEAEQRFEPKQMWLDAVLDPSFPSVIWNSRFGAIDGVVRRLQREVQVLALAEMVESGQLRYSQGERVSMLLDLERVGLATHYYPKSVLASRLREAREIGVAGNEIGSGDLDVDLSVLLAPYRVAIAAVTRQH